MVAIIGGICREDDECVGNTWEQAKWICCKKLSDHSVTDTVMKRTEPMLTEFLSRCPRLLYLLDLIV
ncbi:hypothetical protein HanRHA438_Chr11g0524481 [Helianthus annuus]|nr:hypothetical protein HanRHA438_Chr11g0524481 [Helianthus annuus]